MASVSINGITYSGNNVTVIKNKVYIDGKLSDEGEKSKVINIEITGDVELLDVDTCENIKVSGDVGSINTVNGDINIDGHIAGDIKTVNGDVTSKSDIFGKVKTVNGDIKGKRLKS